MKLNAPGIFDSDEKNESEMPSSWRKYIENNLFKSLPRVRSWKNMESRDSRGEFGNYFCCTKQVSQTNSDTCTQSKRRLSF